TSGEIPPLDLTRHKILAQALQMPRHKMTFPQVRTSGEIPPDVGEIPPDVGEIPHATPTPPATMWRPLSSFLKESPLLQVAAAPHRLHRTRGRKKKRIRLRPKKPRTRPRPSWHAPTPPPRRQRPSSTRSRPRPTSDTPGSAPPRSARSTPTSRASQTGT